MSDTMQVFITKFALTAGIELRTVKTSHTPSMVIDVGKQFQTYHGDGRDWHRTFSSAQKRAEEMRTAKIDSLTKSIDKLEKLDFSGEPS